MTQEVREETVDGIETIFAANHLGHFLFTMLILPRIRAAAVGSFAPRIINVSSIVHSSFPFKIEEVGFKDPATHGPWSSPAAYAQSKNASALFSLELAKRFREENILSFSLHPGGV